MCSLDAEENFRIWKTFSTSGLTVPHCTNEESAAREVSWVAQDSTADQPRGSLRCSCRTPAIPSSAWSLRVKWALNQRFSACKNPGWDQLPSIKKKKKRQDSHRTCEVQTFSFIEVCNERETSDLDSFRKRCINKSESWCFFFFVHF